MKNGIATYKNNIKNIRFEFNDEYIVKISLTDEEKIENDKSELTNEAFLQISEYLAGVRRNFSFSYSLTGTEFEKSVYAELLKIPYGDLKSYKQVALALGNAYLSRAVGRACNKNPLLFVIPCHRVIASDGALRGYSGGIEIKKKLLLIENENLTFKERNIINIPYTILK